MHKLSSPDREFDLSLGSLGGKKQSKLENMLDKLRKRKVCAYTKVITTRSTIFVRFIYIIRNI